MSFCSGCLQMHARPSTSGKHAFRTFTSSTRVTGHYQTLSVPQNATRSQIKSSYYKLSKMYHPDVTADPKAKERFQAVSDAYAVLGDDRKRRAYDRSLSQGRVSAATAQESPSAAHWHHDLRRRRGSTYAWEPRRPGQAPHARPPPGGYQPERQHPDPWVSPHVRRATGKRAPYNPSDMDRVNAESGFWRTAQVVGILMVIVSIGGGFTASAA